MVYTVKNSCMEEPDIPYEDGAVNLFLYTGGEKGEASKELRELLRFIRDTRTENAVNPDLRRLSEIVESVRSDKEVTRSFMKDHDYIRMWLKEGREEGREEGAEMLLITKVARKLAKGKNEEEIAEDLDETTERIHEIVCAIEESGSNDAEEVYMRMRDTVMT